MGKEQVPDFSNCIMDKNGEIWCWDNTANAVCRVIPIYTTIPQEVYIELLQAANERKKDAR